MVDGDDADGQSLGVMSARLAVGLAQGVALYLLYSAVEDRTWPATNGFWFAPLLFVASYVPLILLFSIGNLRTVTLVAWTLVASVLVGALAWYDIWHGLPTAMQVLGSGRWGDGPRILPSFGVCFFTSAAVFIAQALVAGSDSDRRFMAHYAAYFDIGWKLGVQLVLAGLFVGIFWALIELGATLFHVIGIEYFRNLIEHRWFAIPATTLAQAAAIHLTDVRASLVRGTRSLVLVLLSWLLPLMAVIGAGFLGSLFYTGLSPLWNTGFAAGYLLIASSALVVLINAAFQDGRAEHQPHVVLRYAGSLACLLLLPLVVLSAYAIQLRVEQYGWTTSRVASVACLIVATSYAVGYAGALVPGGRWLARIAPWNFFTAILALVVIGCIFSPVADPVRASVDSQVGRLVAGQIDPAKFDFSYLRWNGGRFGVEALGRLVALRGDGRVAVIRSKARAALAEQHENYSWASATPSTLVANISVYPRGRSLPQTFVKQDWNAVQGILPPCLRSARDKCDAYLLDLAGDGRQEIVIVGGVGLYFYGNGVFAQQPDGSWKLVGRPGSLWRCRSVADALQSGKFEIVPAQPRWREVKAAGARLTILETEDTKAGCTD